MSNGHIYERGKVWWYQFKVDGQRYRGPIGEVSKSIASDIAARKRLEAIQGKLLPKAAKSPWFGEFDAATGEFSDGAKEYLKFCQAHQRDTTFERTGRTMRILCKFFGKKRLEEITSFLIERYKSDEAARGQTEGTIVRDLAVLSHYFALAVRWGWINKNPVSDVQRPKLDNERVRWLSREEEGALLAECRQPHLRVAVVLGLATGFRAGEMQTIKWENVNFATNTITFKRRKNGMDWSCPMLTEYREALLAWKAAKKPVVESEAIIGSYTYRKSFDRACARAKLKDVIFYTLRHTFISRVAQVCTNPKELQFLAGHRSLKMTMRYIHLSDTATKTTMARLEQVLNAQADVTTKVTTFPIATGTDNV